uniref:RAP domain-containing protein n=1 Tax=Babesia bovis TaxID=5865 RepID=A7ASI3_BABBO|eukprot:XP_001611070.1 hypothetical protein [Babesia bovis T2Bo]
MTKCDCQKSIGAALILNALKRLEVPNHDIIELATNELCLKMDHANLQDIALTANALAYFQVQHHRFWNMLTRSVSLRHHQMTPLQASLILASLAKMDMRNPLMLRLLKDKLRAAVERGDLSQELLTLCFHSLAKLDFSANNFYNACTEQFTQMLDMQPEAVDTQSLVLYLYTAVCILDVPQTAIVKCLEVLAQRKDVLSNYKAGKMKFVIDFLENKYPAILEVLNKETLDLLDKIKEYKLYKAKKTLSRWSLEVSRCLKKHNIRHRTNVQLGHLYADILIPDLSVIVKCAGPFSYYVKSQKLTTFAQIEHKALTMKGYKVCILPYYEWNALKTDDQKLEYLKKFGETWASVHFGNGTEQLDMA